MVQPLPLVTLAAFGAVIGSGLGTWIDRLLRDENGVRAKAPSVASHGQRRGAVRVLPRRALVGAVTAAMFAFGGWHYGPGLLLASRSVLGCVLIVLFVVDLERHRLPNVVTVPGMAIGFLFSLFGPPGWVASLGGMVGGGGLLLLVAELQYRFRGEERLGMGDVKMLAMIGAFLGWPLMFVALVLALFSGSAISLGLMAVRGRDLPAVLPFGTFLALGAAGAATIGPTVLDWYLALW